ncbi:MAG: zf-HC2 domain-containing protein [Anaerolineaceae bacterium]|nr:zf-HC2 domain-containing protein [Anaerolineaceae bacterium]
MRAHAWFEEQLPFFLNGQLDPSEQAEVSAHLRECSACREELAFWQGVSAEVEQQDRSIQSPQVVPETVILHVKQPLSLWRILKDVWRLLVLQVPLVRQDMWPASALMMFIGVAVAVVTEKTSVLYFVAPMVAAAMLALIYGVDNDPANELTLATATSPAIILFARMSLVSAFNLGLTLAASLAVVLFLPQVTFWGLVLTWLAPMAFLSMLALVLSMWVGSSNAVALTYCLWVLQFIPLQQLRLFSTLPAWMQKVSLLQDLWQNNLVLLIGTFCLFILALLGTRFSSFSLTRRAV